MKYHTISEKKQAQIDAFIKEPFKVGNIITIPECELERYSVARDKSCEIIKVDGDEITLTYEYGRGNPTKTFTRKHLKSVYKEVQSHNIGATPIDPDDRLRRVQATNFSLDSILFQIDAFEDRNRYYTIEELPVAECNWNPFIYDKNGKKKYYQRGFVWSVKEKQLLIDSIYNNIDCGKIVIRKRGWQELEKMAKKGERELSFNDIVDGKQRLNAVISFMKDEFPDSLGNYYGDLSYMSQNMFLNHQLFSYSELPENTPDEDILKLFLRLNFAGIPQSQEHINYVKSLL